MCVNTWVLDSYKINEKRSLKPRMGNQPLPVANSWSEITSKHTNLDVTNRVVIRLSPGCVSTHYNALLPVDEVSEG